MLARRFDHRWKVAFAFGLVHGFGFSFALRESLQFAGAHLFPSLLSFNVGIELGQVLILALLIPPLNFVFRHADRSRSGRWCCRRSSRIRRGTGWSIGERAPAVQVGVANARRGAARRPWGGCSWP